MNEETLYLYLNNELSKEEQQLVEEWIRNNPGEYKKLKIIWEKSAIDNSSVKPDMKGMWGNIISEIENSEDNKQYRKISIYKSILKYAAIFILCFGISGYFVYKKINHIEWVEYASNNNSANDILLPDGSTITLNKVSTLFYKKQFLSADREVKLNGEAFFQVKRNPKKPFIINVNNTVVKVLGTSFNIDASDTSGNVTVSVKSGKVMFYEKGDTSNVVYLLKGDMGIFTPHEQKITKTGIPNENYLAWKTGILLFKDNDLQEVCEVLNEYYDTNIIADYPALKEKKLTARYQNKSLTEVLDLLSLALDLKYIQKGDNIYLIAN